jgi:hypothetical protein
MKIHEPLGNPADLELASSACAVYRDTIAQLRNEFQEFITQTRERLQYVCEALEQDRDAMSVESLPVEAMCREAMCGGSSQPVPFAGDAIEPGSPLNPVPVIEPISVSESISAIRSRSAMEPLTRVEPVSMNDLSLSADDPFERINAIKQRLAKQIKSY